MIFNKYIQALIKGLKNVEKDLEINIKDNLPLTIEPGSYTGTLIFNPVACRRWIFVTTEKEGVHCYPAAATDPKLATGDDMDVSFLATPHRHMFKFNVRIEVYHNDRDLEFIQVKRQINKWLGTDIDMNYKSCEMLAEDLYGMISNKWPNRGVIIEVSEDGENGAILDYSFVSQYH